MDVRVGLGQDTHAFVAEGESKLLIMGGVSFMGERGLAANSDGDVVLHALTRAFDSILGTTYLGSYADELCKKGVTDSMVYFEAALTDLKKRGFVITQLAVTLECLTPKIMPKVPLMQKRLSDVCQLDIARIGFTCETGDGLTDFARGKGIRCVAAVTVVKE